MIILDNRGKGVFAAEESIQTPVEALLVDDEIRLDLGLPSEESIEADFEELDIENEGAEAEESVESLFGAPDLEAVSLEFVPERGEVLDSVSSFSEGDLEANADTGAEEDEAGGGDDDLDADDDDDLDGLEEVELVEVEPAPEESENPWLEFVSAISIQNELDSDEMIEIATDAVQASDLDLEEGEIETQLPEAFLTEENGLEARIGVEAEESDVTSEDVADSLEGNEEVILSAEPDSQDSTVGDAELDSVVEIKDRAAGEEGTIVELEAFVSEEGVSFGVSELSIVNSGEIVDAEVSEGQVVELSFTETEIAKLNLLDEVVLESETSSSSLDVIEDRIEAASEALLDLAAERFVIEDGELEGLSAEEMVSRQAEFSSGFFEASEQGAFATLAGFEPPEVETFTATLRLESEESAALGSTRLWSLNDEVEEEQTITVRLLGTDEGEVDMVQTVNFINPVRRRARIAVSRELEKLDISGIDLPHIEKMIEDQIQLFQNAGIVLTDEEVAELIKAELSR